MNNGEREPGWLREEIDRATKRAEKVPAWARPVLIDRRRDSAASETVADADPDQGT